MSHTSEIRQHASDPQRKSRTRLSPNLLLALCLGFFLLGTVAIYARATFDSQSPAKQPLKVDTVTIEQVPQYSVTRQFSGRIEPRQRVNIASEVSGKVISMKYDEGDQINKYDTLVVLDTQLLQTELSRLTAQLSGVDAELDLADLRLQRQNNLQKKGFSSDDTVDAIETQITNLKSQRRTLTAQIHSVEIRLEKSTIRAPFDGIIQRRFADEGAVISTSTPLLELIENATAEIKLGVPVSIAKILQKGKQYDVEASSSQARAEIISIAPEVDFTTQTVSIRMRLLDDSHNLTFGEFVNLSLPVPVDRSGFWIPNTALIEGERGLWSIYRVDEDDTVRRHAVTIVATDNLRSFVAAPIDSRAQIIASGPHRITPGMRVEM